MACLCFETVAKQNLTPEMRKNDYDFTIETEMKGSLMERSILDFHSFLRVICILTGAQAFS